MKLKFFLNQIKNKIKNKCFLKGNIDYSTFYFKQKKKGKKAIKIDRQLLYDHWASWKCLLKFQPIDQIEKYFGTKVAFYFAWLGNFRLNKV